MHRHLEFLPASHAVRYTGGVTRWRISAVKRLGPLERSRSRRDEDETLAAHLTYKRKKAELNREIAMAKEKSWHELLAVIDEDPWGFPYRTIVKRLTYGSNMTEVLEDEVLENLLDSLFPKGDELRPIDWEGERGRRWRD